MIKGKVKQIETMGLLDGPGIRTVIFLQGCPLRCLFCHNPEMFDYDAETNEFTPEELLNIIKKYEPYFGNTGGVTFSGGEPLMQSKFLKEITALCQKNGINVVLDTSGSIINDDIEALLDNVDLVLLDIKATDKESYHKMTGGSITTFHSFLELLKKKNKKLWLRTVIVPGINDNLEFINKLALYIKDIPNVEKIELLPYHKMGDIKYEQLGLHNPLKETKAMNVNKCKRLENTLKELLK